MGQFEEVIINIDKMAKDINQNDGDYIGEDGLLYCGNCHTAKQVVIGNYKRNCVCKCKMEQLEKEDQQRKQEQLYNRIEAQRKKGFTEAELMNWNFANDDRTNEKLSSAMQRYVDNFEEFKSKGKGLLLWGSVGTGKTFYACCIANALIDKGIPCLVTNFARLTNTIQGSFQGRQEFIDGLNNYKLLVIDDLGAERQSEFMQEMVFNIIDARYRAGLPFIITTNLNIEEIKNPSGVGNARIYDRILERCFPIAVQGTSRRKKKIIEDFEETKNLLGL